MYVPAQVRDVVGLCPRALAPADSEEDSEVPFFIHPPHIKADSFNASFPLDPQRTLRADQFEISCAPKRVKRDTTQQYTIDIISKDLAEGRLANRVSASLWKMIVFQPLLDYTHQSHPWKG